MKNTFYTTLIALMLTLTLSLSKSAAQIGCNLTNYNFTTQGAIDSFPILYPGCTEIGADVFISGPDITNLSGLLGVKHISGSLYLENLTALESLSGLDSLERAWIVWIQSCSRLKNLEGIGPMWDILALVINNCDSLINLTGLENFRGAEGLDLRNNDELLSLEGIIPPFSVSNLDIVDNPKLEICHTEVICNFLNNPDDPMANWLKINGNGANCLNKNVVRENCALNYYSIDLSLGYVPNGDCESPYINLNGPLTTRIDLRRPSGLNNIKYSALNTKIFNVYPVDTAYISFPQYPNKNWEICKNEFIVEPLPAGDTAFHQVLLKPLNYCPELTVSIALPSTFRGCLVTTDVKVGTQNTGTVPAENVLLSVVIPFNLMEVDAANPSPVAQSGDTLFFALGDLDVFENSDVLLTLRTRCDTFLIGHTICLEAFAEMDNPCPPDLPLGSIVKTTASCIGNDIVRFTLTNIGDEATTSPHQYFIIEDEVVLMIDTFSLNVMEAIDVDVDATGSTFRMEATKLPDGTLTAAALEGCGGISEGMINAFWLEQGPSNYAIGCRRVTLAYDPNDKLAIPSGVGPMNLLAANRPIEYTIRFQNTGTDTAYRVLLTDVLPPQMAVSSFRPGFASHDYTWEILNDTLQVLFFPIALPDSAASLEGSQGFFTFSMDQKLDLPDGTLIQNTASIIFDFNPPIVTITVFHTIGKLIVSIDHPQRHSDLWQLHGNPTRELAVFRSPTSIPGKKQFALFDMMGRTMRMDTFDGHEYVFHRGILGSGMYMFRITDAEGRPFTGLIVVAD